MRILGGKTIKPENSCYIKLANSWIILNPGGGPTPDKPEVVLEAPSDRNRVNRFSGPARRRHLDLLQPMAREGSGFPH